MFHYAESQVLHLHALGRFCRYPFCLQSTTHMFFFSWVNTIVPSHTCGAACRAAGTYEVTVRDRTSGKLLGGPAIELVMKPGAINPQLSSFHVRGLQLKGNLAAMLAGSSIDIAPTVYASLILSIHNSHACMHACTLSLHLRRSVKGSPSVPITPGTNVLAGTADV